jgi:hypothetical protein
VRLTSSDFLIHSCTENSALLKLNSKSLDLPGPGLLSSVIQRLCIRHFSGDQELEYNFKELLWASLTSYKRPINSGDDSNAYVNGFPQAQEVLHIAEKLCARRRIIPVNVVVRARIIQPDFLNVLVMSRESQFGVEISRIKSNTKGVVAGNEVRKVGCEHESWGPKPALY